MPTTAHRERIILALILLLGIMIGISACTPRTAPTAGGLIAEVKTACVNACAAQEATTVTLNISMPPNTTLYTTREAICAKDGNRLFCARCPCDITNSTFDNGDLRCAMTRNEAGIAVTCVTIPVS